jgi:hypothetical protein
MNKKFNLGFLSVLAVVLSIVFSSSVSAKSETSQLLSTTLVISQAYGGGGGTTGTYQFDYVELKNISSSPQSLNGLSLTVCHWLMALRPDNLPAARQTFSLCRMSRSIRDSIF